MACNSLGQSACIRVRGGPTGSLAATRTYCLWSDVLIVVMSSSPSFVVRHSRIAGTDSRRAGRSDNAGTAGAAHLPAGPDRVRRVQDSSVRLPVRPAPAARLWRGRRRARWPSASWTYRTRCGYGAGRRQAGSLVGEPSVSLGVRLPHAGAGPLGLLGGHVGQPAFDEGPVGRADGSAGQRGFKRATVVPELPRGQPVQWVRG